MDISADGSSVSLVESEKGTAEARSNCIRKLGLNLNGIPVVFHQYNTRHSTKLKKLYVDLSNSRLEAETARSTGRVSENGRFDLVRRDSTTSQDSREFDLSNYDFQLAKTNCNNIMDDRERQCIDGVNRVQKAWLKYFYALCFVGIIYIYLEVIHNGEEIRRITKEVNGLKQEIRYEPDAEGKFYRIETILNNMKREQEANRKSFKNLINTELAKFSSDKTGKTDFALEASGGKIVSLTSGTENFDYTKSLFGITLCEGMQGPRAMLQADMSPGHCWAIKGSQGGAIVKLIGQVVISSVSIEHIPEYISPTGEISSAPKEFSVWGLRSATDRGQQLGQFTYDMHGPLVQTFTIKNSKTFEYVEFTVLSNHGNSDFTCVYRFRVHGELEKH
ncbi:unnamed protein product [Phaedon cochleariae]|uniref:SUN domain-containing protein n=1 Tax=Phaedon cochleariae TaxID=80249 RepID=A0A9P0DFT9_PHACE|nr:unnamed protein product [Phaedon cochleariae]